MSLIVLLSLYVLAITIALVLFCMDDVKCMEIRNQEFL